MPLFQDLDVEFRLDTLTVVEHSDRFFGGVEPYVIPLFFKLDGERYSAILRILNTQPPDEGTTEVVETSSVQFELESDPERDPLILLPPGPILFDDTLESGDELDISRIAITTTLQPVPLVIDLAGVANLRQILEALAAAPVLQEILEGTPIDALNLTLQGISEVVAAALGLDETLETCPDFDIETEGLIERIEAELNSLIPGTIGGVFVAMENDDFDEDDVVTIRNTVRNEIRRTLNDITDSVTRVNPIPDPDPAAVDRDALFSNVVGDLFFRCDPVFWFVAIVGFLWASADEFVGFHLQQFDHMTIDPAGNTFGAEMAGSENLWQITGTLAVS